SNLVKGTFPGSDYFSVRARGDSSRDNAATLVREMLSYRTRTAQVRMHAEPLYRQMLLAGNSVAKYHYVRQVIGELRRPRSASVTIMRAAQKVLPVFDGPRMDLVDIMGFYVFPETANNLWNAELCFEDITVPASVLREHARKGHYNMEAVEQAAAAGQRQA